MLKIVKFLIFVVITAAFMKTNVLEGITVKLLSIINVATTDNLVFYGNLFISAVISAILTLVMFAVLYAVLKPVVDMFRKK